MPKYQDDSLAGQRIARDGLSMDCPAMPFGNRVRELERKFMSAYETTCIRLGEGGDMLHHRSRQVVGD